MCFLADSKQTSHENRMRSKLFGCDAVWLQKVPKGGYNSNNPSCSSFVPPRGLLFWVQSGLRQDVEKDSKLFVYICLVQVPQNHGNRSNVQISGL